MSAESGVAAADDLDGRVPRLAEAGQASATVLVRLLAASSALIRSLT